MPIYPYKCNKCDNYEEKFFSMASMPKSSKKIDCEKCGKKSMVRQFDAGVPNVDDGPKSLRGIGEKNFKKLSQEEREKIFPTKKNKLDMNKIRKIKDVEKYIMTGEI